MTAPTKESFIAPGAIIGYLLSVVVTFGGIIVNQKIAEFEELETKVKKHDLAFTIINMTPDQIIEMRDKVNDNERTYDWLKRSHIEHKKDNEKRFDKHREDIVKLFNLWDNCENCH